MMRRGAAAAQVSTEELLKELNAISAQLETVVGMDKIAEQQLFRDLEENSETAAKLLEVIVKTKKAGQDMTEQLEAGGDVRDEEGNLVASKDNDNTEIAQAILRAAEAKKVYPTLPPPSRLPMTESCSAASMP